MPKKSIFKRTWHFLWHDNSILSWVVNVILAFVIIKFLLYPGLGLVMGTDFPIVAVVSGSMEHSGGFESWWTNNANCELSVCTQGQYYSEHSISKQEFKDFPFHNGFNKGDIMVLIGDQPKDIKIGDILIFKSNRADPIIHRVVEEWYEDEYHFRTKGDNNQQSYDQILETDIEEDRIVGKAILRIPWLGWVKLAFIELINLAR